MFGTRLSSDHEDHRVIAETMKLRSNKPNKLQVHVNEENWNRKTRVFKPIEHCDNIQFPQLSPNELKMITLGSYQLKQANGYLVEHFSTAEKRKFECFTDKWNGKDVIRARVQSRHKSGSVYFIYVSFDSVQVDEWYCSCFMGARNVGCCAHVAAIITYFASGKRIPPGVEKMAYFMNLFRHLKDIVLVDGESDFSDTD